MDQGKVYNWYVDEPNVGERIDTYVTGKGSWSRTLVQTWIQAEHITVNGRTIKANYRLRSDDRIRLWIPPVKRLTIEPEPMDLHIVYEDKDVIVVNKPRGMIVHPVDTTPSGTLVNALLAHSSELSGVAGQLRPGIVHRLDKDTSGLIMAAKNDDAHESLASQLAAHTVLRAYRALVHGVIAHNHGTIDAPIGRHPVRRQEMAVVRKNSKRAVTHFSVDETFAEHTLVECRLETGRMHQIRVHMAYIGHPLVGDPKYGVNKNNDIYAIQGQALHAHSLTFRHPRTGEQLTFRADLPLDMRAILDELRKM